jgi:hypothetical protein
MKVIIAGSRIFNNYKLLESTVNNLHLDISEIVCGGAKGADTLGADYANKYKIPIKYFIPKWNINGLYNPKAGFERNREMAIYADYLIAFDMNTNGTKNMIYEMKELNKSIYIEKLY